MCVRYKARGAAGHVGHEVDKARQHVKHKTRQVKFMVTMHVGSKAYKAWKYVGTSHMTCETM